MAKAPSVRWTREHFLIALNLYYKLPFGRYDRKNPLVIEVAKRMGRTPSSLAMKLGNFSSLDPVHRARGVRGLANAGREDRQMWAEFRDHLSTLGPESEQMLHDLFTRDEDREVDFTQPRKIRLEPSRIALPPDGPTERSATIRVRRGQQFFRQSILAAYGVRCCISGINVPQLLVASHIKPWSDFPNERLSPRNGLCLSSLHDAAFDSGLISIDDQNRVLLSRRLKEFFPQPSLEQNFKPFEGCEIQLPSKLAEPDPSYLSFHRETIFQG